MRLADNLASITIADIAYARDILRDLVIRTPLLPFAHGAPDRTIWLKPECLQTYGSYKIRCASYAALSLTEEQRSKGIFTASAGNFGQGVAAAAKALGVSVRVYAPDSAARIKIAAMRALGAEVIEISFQQWWSILGGEHPARESRHFIHPCAGREVIIGNATLAVEILEDAPDVDAILVPFGGGGLTLGVATAVRLTRPEVDVIACEAATSTPLTAALKAGRPVEVACDRTGFIDGIGGSMVLPTLWPLLQSAVAGTEVVPEAQVAEAIATLHRGNHLVVEGAGAVPVCAAMSSTRFMGRKVAAIISGGNIDEPILSQILSGVTSPIKPAL